MEVVNRSLKDDGLFFLHSIVGNEHVGAAEAAWLNKYIFPNGELPSLAQIAESVEGLFIVEALHHFGTDYERTLYSWHEKFLKNWDTLKGSYDERFFRMWKLYLQMSGGIFRARIAHVWQGVFSKNGIPGNGQPIHYEFGSYDAR